MATQEGLPPTLRELTRKFKQGYTLERTKGGHYRIRDRSGRLVQYRRKNLTLTGNPSPGAERAMIDQLTAAKVLKGTEPQRRPKADRTRRTEQLGAIREERQQQVNALHDRLAEMLTAVGGLDMPGMQSDLAQVGSAIAREQGKPELTPDLMANSAYRVQHRAPIVPVYMEVWAALAERLERAPDRVGAWYSLVREARGLPVDRIEVKPTGEEPEWPFRVELLSIVSLLADPAYQRPVNWSFVRGAAQRFEPSLVGTIDVAQRSPSQYAILDGQQRTNICKLVGLSTVWASIYVGLDAPSEARFFLHKNKDRRNVHPYYTFRARVAAHDAAAVAIDGIVTGSGYRVAIGAPKLDERQGNIAAIAALERAYNRQRPGSNGTGAEALTPTLALLRETTLGRPHGQSAAMIGGVSLLYSLYGDSDVDADALKAALVTVGPELVIGRARDVQRTNRGTIDTAVLRVLVSEHDARADRGGRLDKRRLRDL